jgi:hypothetical protein
MIDQKTGASMVVSLCNPLTKPYFIEWHLHRRPKIGSEKIFPAFRKIFQLIRWHAAKTFALNSVFVELNIDSRRVLPDFACRFQIAVTAGLQAWRKIIG